MIEYDNFQRLRKLGFLGLFFYVILKLSIEGRKLYEEKIETKN